jgi:Zinc-finger of C2H2 type
MSIEFSGPNPSTPSSQDSTGPYECEMCKILFNSEEELANHTQEVHKGTMASMGTQDTMRQIRRKSKSKVIGSAKRKSIQAKTKTKMKSKKRKVMSTNRTGRKRTKRRSK